MRSYYRTTFCVFVGFIIGFAVHRSWCYFSLYNTDSLAPKVTCQVFIRSGHFRNVNASKITWLPKCDDYIIVSLDKGKKAAEAFKRNDSCQHPSEMYTVVADNGWDFLCTALRIAPKPLNWLLIVPDSLLVVVENLKKLVRELDWRKEYYLGHPVRHYSADFNVLSAGILLSNATVERLLGRFQSKALCRAGGKFWNNEDKLLGQYLKEIGILPVDTRDNQGRTRFHGFNVNTLLFPGSIFRKTDYFKKAIYPVLEGPECCSEDLITIDTSDAEHMLVHNHLLNGRFKAVTKSSSLFKSINATVPRWVHSLKEIGYLGPTDNITDEQYYKIWEKHISPEMLGAQMKKTADVYNEE